MIRKRIKRRYYYLINSFLILFFSLFIFNIYCTKTNGKINLLSEDYFQKKVNNSLHNMIYKTVDNNDINSILEIYKNKDGEILYIDYNLNNTYKLLRSASGIIKELLDNDIENEIIYKVPFLVGSNNVFFSNLGPKITIKINYVNSILTNVYTKITNYGLNNALIEAYIKVTVEGRIITPVSDKRKVVNYDMLISSTIINGRVPSYYGNYLTSNSSIFDVPIN